MAGTTRRDFLKKSGQAALATFGGLELIAGCATVETPRPQDTPPSLASIKPEPVVYPTLPGQKIQAPENGCLVGFRRVYAADLPADYTKEGMEITKNAHNIDEYVKGVRDRQMDHPKWDSARRDCVTNYIEYYEHRLGKKPGILVFYETPKLFANFPTKYVSEAAHKGTIPYVYALPWVEQKKSLRFELSDIVAGKHDSHIKNLADGAKQYGEQYGGFFITTMEESNGNWYYWGQNRDFVPAWKHIWEAFEDKGANQYATWVWECYCPETTTRAQDPEFYYPGDKYVDWIGLSAFALSKYPTTLVPFGALVGRTYDQMRRRHPHKPIMQAEFGYTALPDQHRWIRNTYATIKSMPGMKAAIFRDIVDTNENDDRRLTPKSLETLREILKDPYFIMAK